MTQFSQTLRLLGINEVLLNQFAFDANFKKRVRKLTGFDYILILLSNVSKDVMSYNTLASSLYKNPLKCVKRQALQKAMKNDNFLKFVNDVLNRVLMNKIGLPGSKLSRMFGRIVVQDSTIVKLPQRLFELYSGIKNQSKQVTNSRIQFTIDILKNSLIGMSIDPFSINDAKAAKILNPIAKDLILRDRGYFLISEICRIITAKAFFIYRYHPIYNYYHIKTGKVLDLQRHFRNRKMIDMQVRLGGQDGPIVRLLAMTIDEKLANHRRFLIRRDKRNNPSKSTLALLSWSIYLTNIEDESMSYSEIFELYKLRWRIEIIFKAIKSNLKLDSIHNVSEIQFKFIVTAKMIMIIIAIQYVYEPLVHIIKKIYKQDLSLLKLVRFIIDNGNVLRNLIEYVKQKKRNICKDLDNLSKYCCYDKRKRKNYEEAFATILS